jgi:hypothetical protein
MNQLPLFNVAWNEVEPDFSMMTERAAAGWRESKKRAIAEHQATIDANNEWNRQIAERRAAFAPPAPSLNTASQMELDRIERERAREAAAYKSRAGEYRRRVIEHQDNTSQWGLMERNDLLTEFARRAGIIGRNQNLTTETRAKAEYYIHSAEGASLFPPDQPVKRPQPVKSKYAKYKNDRCHFVCPSCGSKYLSEDALDRHLATTLSCPECHRCCSSGRYHDCHGEDIRLLKDSDKDIIWTGREWKPRYQFEGER